MATAAFLLINVDPGTQTKVFKEMKSIPIVKKVHLTYGVFDIVVRVEAETQEELKKAITYEIRALRHVRSTLTMIVAGT